MPPIVETFDSIPSSINTTWTAGPVNWTSKVTVADSPLSWTAFNVRRDAVEEASKPALAFRANSTATKGYLASGPVPLSIQRLTASFRQIYKQTSDCDIYVNGNLVRNYRSSGSTTQVDKVSIDTFDPATSLPFAPPVTVVFSNRVAGFNPNNFAIDDIEFTPWTMLISLDKPGTNTVSVCNDEFIPPPFEVAASLHFPGELPDDVSATGVWSMTPDFEGTVSGLAEPVLSLVPAVADAGKTFTLSYTATLVQPISSGEEGEDGAEPATFSHTASCCLEVVQRPSPRFLDFEEFAAASAKFNYATDAPALHTLAGASWLTQNVRNSQANSNAFSTADPCIGSWSLRVRHESAERPALFASDFPFPDGIGTVSFRYANYSRAAENASMTLVAQTRAEDEEEWTDIPDGTLVITNHYDIGDWEFRIDAQQPGPRRFRLLSTAGVTPKASSIADIDDLYIRPFGETAPVLRFCGTPGIPAETDWSAYFCYTNATGPYEWDWSLSDSFPGLVCTTNAEEHTLCFSVTARPATRATNWLTVAVWTNGVKDQQLSVPLSVVTPPSFRLYPRYAPCTNTVDVYVADVTLYGGGTNWSVAWTADPPFNGTNTLHNKSRYRVIQIVQEDTTEHLLTAVLTDRASKLTATNTILVTVLPSNGGETDDGGDDFVVPPPACHIVGFSPTNLLVTDLVPGCTYTSFAFAEPGKLSPPVWTAPAAVTAGAADTTISLPLPGPSLLGSPLFFAISGSMP